MNVEYIINRNEEVPTLNFLDQRKTHHSHTQRRSPRPAPPPRRCRRRHRCYRTPQFSNFLAEKHDKYGNTDKFHLQFQCIIFSQIIMTAEFHFVIIRNLNELKITPDMVSSATGNNYNAKIVHQLLILFLNWNKFVIICLIYESSPNSWYLVIKYLITSV